MTVLLQMLDSQLKKLRLESFPPYLMQLVSSQRAVSHNLPRKLTPFDKWRVSLSAPLLLDITHDSF